MLKLTYNILKLIFYALRYNSPFQSHSWFNRHENKDKNHENI